MNYAMKYDIIAEITNKATYQCLVYSFDLVPKKFQWDNTNKLLNEYFIGSKTGITPGAGPCLVTQF
jgi:D-alanyl-D-alanine carboxypeptidase